MLPVFGIAKTIPVWNFEIAGLLRGLHPDFASNLREGRPRARGQKQSAGFPDDRKARRQELSMQERNLGTCGAVARNSWPFRLAPHRTSEVHLEHVQHEVIAVARRLRAILLRLRKFAVAGSDSHFDLR